jgi:hypothetical protein
VSARANAPRVAGAFDLLHLGRIEVSTRYTSEPNDKWYRNGPIHRRKNSYDREIVNKFLNVLVGRVGIEPTTNGLRASGRGYRYIVNQVLAALANLETNVVQSQFGHRSMWVGHKLNRQLGNDPCPIAVPCGIHVP